MRHSPCVRWLYALPILFLSIIVAAQQIPATTEVAAEVQIQIERLKQGDAAAAAMRLQILGSGAKAAIPALTEALKHQEPAVRMWAARALAEMAPESKSALQSLFQLEKEDPDPGVRMFAGKAGKKIANTPDGEAAPTEPPPAVALRVPPLPQAEGGVGQPVRPANTQPQVRRQPPGAQTHAMAARLQGTWQADFSLEGDSYSETLTLSADGSASSRVVERSDNTHWSATGRYQYAGGRLRFSYVGEKPYEQSLTWIDGNRFRLSDGEVAVEYQRVPE